MLIYILLIYSVYTIYTPINLTQAASFCLACVSRRRDIGILFSVVGVVVGVVGVTKG